MGTVVEDRRTGVVGFRTSDTRTDGVSAGHLPGKSLVDVLVGGFDKERLRRPRPRGDEVRETRDVVSSDLGACPTDPTTGSDMVRLIKLRYVNLLQKHT